MRVSMRNKLSLLWILHAIALIAAMMLWSLKNSSEWAFLLLMTVLILGINGRSAEFARARI